MSQTYYIETMGCQMNKLDSELIAGRLAELSYRPTEDADNADIIVFNTCSVRQHAEDKVISKIGQLGQRHRDEPDLILIVVGCMVQRLGQELLDAHPQVDIACAPGQIHHLTTMIQDLQQDRRQLLALNDPAQSEDLEALDTSRTASIPGDTPFMAYLRIMRGCNKHCTYCVVPSVRGPERCRPLDHIAAEAARLVAAGVKEITLLGQTVNSYKYVHQGKTLGLADVLEELHDLPGLARLRFVTSHPRDFDDRIFHAMADLPKVCPYLHVPAQSGSDRILKAMHRRYTAADYLALIDRARRIIPDIAIAGDFIVGFPDETDQDFAATKDLMRQVRYKNCFIFKYSPRPGTRGAARLPDNIPDNIKRQRNTELLELQNAISLEDNQRFVGQTIDILIEGLSKKPHLNTGATDSTHPQLIGRTPGDHIVVLNAPEDLIGQITPVTITNASALTLFANRIIPT